MLIAHTAPDFTTQAVMSDGSIEKSYNLFEKKQNKYAVLFFYPFDFTFVCPSELIALDKRMDVFKKLNAEVIACSVDSVHVHHAWRRTSINEGGIGPVNYTMIQDVDHAICQSYGVEHHQEKTATRAAFIIDQNNVVQAQIMHNLPLGRNVDEIIRVMQALQHHEKHGEVCPVGWQEGQRSMVPDQDGVKAYLKEMAETL